MSKFPSIKLSEELLKTNKRNAWYVASLVKQQMMKLNANKDDINQFVFDMLNDGDCEDIDRYLKVCKEYVTII